MKKILFISHEASRTGAPLVLLYFMQWLKKTEPTWVIHLATLNGGALLSEFEISSDALFQSSGLEQKYLKRSGYIYSRIYDKLFHQQTFRQKYMNDHYSQISSGNYDIIYANTVVSIPFAIEIEKRSAATTKLIVHMHELESIIQGSMPDFNKHIPFIDGFIAASNPVKENLVRKHQVKDELTHVVYECSRVNLSAAAHTEKKKFTVGGSGYAHWRKGDDLFIQIARYLRSNYPDSDVHFQWVGEVPDHQRIIIEEDILKAGLEQYVEFTGATSTPHSYYTNFDVFLLVSREDPFPLVCIETAMLEKPIICFDKGNGIADIISLGGGSIIPYLNIEEAATKIMMYYQNPDIKIRHGQEAAVLFGKFTPENQCPEILRVIKSITGGEPA